MWKILCKIYTDINNKLIKNPIKNYVSGNKIKGNRNPKPIEIIDKNIFKNNVVYSVSCGCYDWKCLQTTCHRCNPMTDKKASEINSRYLKEKGYEQ